MAFTLKLRFESSVISYGSQTNKDINRTSDWFESSVISYGSQTDTDSIHLLDVFESSVISYGSQTCVRY